MASVLGYVEQLKEADTSEADRIPQIMGLENILREDRIETSDERHGTREKILSNMPQMEDDYLYKEIKDGRILPNELRDGVVFVDKTKPGEILVLRLKNIDTNEIALFEMELQ